MRHSVVIPAFNAARYLEDSVASALVQLGPDDEILIVDDGSTDRTQAVIDQLTDPRIHALVHPSRRGTAAARNLALDAVTGDYVHFLDHDDCWTADRLSRLRPVLQTEQPDVISGWVEHFYCTQLTEEQRVQYLLPMPQAAALPGSVVIRRDVIERIGRFDGSLSSGEFIDFLSRGLALGLNWRRIDFVLFRRRIHGNNHTLTDQALQHSYLEVIRRHLARQRQSVAIASDS